MSTKSCWTPTKYCPKPSHVLFHGFLTKPYKALSLSLPFYYRWERRTNKWWIWGSYVDDLYPKSTKMHFCNIAYILTVSFFFSLFAIDKKELGNKNTNKKFLLSTYTHRLTWEPKNIYLIIVSIQCHLLYFNLEFWEQHPFIHTRHD